jgi:hypothetical protein
MKSVASVVIGVLLAAGTAAAQTRNDDLAEPQIGASDRGVATSQLTEGARGAGAPADQLSPSVRGAAPPDQVAPGPKAPGAEQLSAEPRNAQPPAPLSHRADGRDLRASRLSGTDACDPARLANASAAQLERCRDALEQHASEMPSPQRPEPPSREEVALQPSTTASASDAGLAAQVLGRGDPDGSLAAQAIAGRTQQQPEPANVRAKDAPMASSDVAAVLQGIQSGAPTVIAH